ncbi:hypothetical protein ACLF3G_03230 [Falsiroseomonas sp. HC035]|uniref:hypothetical protein n=1 Tax=Falsiroseomonas sp. HC035 TaxID=3390999 RepID=UPI003D315141
MYCASGGRHGSPQALVADPAPNRQLQAYRAAAAAAVEEARARLEVLTAANDPSAPAIATVSAINGYLAGLPADALLRDAPVTVAKARGDLRDQLSGARHAVEQLVAERDPVLGAPPAEADVVAMIRARVALLAERGRPMIATDAVHCPTAQAEVYAERPPGVIMPDALAAMSWAQPELLVTRLHDEARRVTKDSGRQPVVPAAQRASAVAALDEQILAAERHEEAVLVALEAAAVTVAHRPDADPRAVPAITGPAPGSK